MSRPRSLDGLKQWDLASIAWEDAEIGSNGWEPISDVLEHWTDGNAFVQTVGFIIRFGENQLVLAHTYDITNKSINGFMVIPYVNIRKATKLKGS